MKEELKKDLEEAMREFLFEPVNVETKNEIQRVITGVLGSYGINIFPSTLSIDDDIGKVEVVTDGKKSVMSFFRPDVGFVEAKV